MTDNEREHEQQSGPEVVTAAYLRRTFADIAAEGITDPSELPENDLNVRRAWEQFLRWQDQEEARIASGPSPDTARLAHKIHSASLLVSAGFTSPRYLQTVIDDLETYRTKAEELGSRGLVMGIEIALEDCREKLQHAQEMPVTSERNATPKQREAEPSEGPIDIEQVAAACVGVLNDEIIAGLKEETEPEMFLTAVCERLAHVGVTDPLLFLRNRGVSL